MAMTDARERTVTADLLTGAWVKGTEGGGRVDAPVPTVADEDVVAEAVQAVLRLFSESAPASEVRPTEHGWIVQLGAVALAVTESSVEVTGHTAGLVLDPLVATSLAGEVARRLGANVTPTSTTKISAGPAAPDVVDKIREHARSRPESVAVRLGESSLSFAELIAVADRRAAELDASRQGGVVVVRFDRSIESVVELVGVLVSGRAYLLQSARDDSDYARTAAHFVSTQDTSGAIRADGGHAGAYVQFTSGTTGTPKAIVVERAQLSAYCAFLEAEGICGPAVAMPVLSAPEFDAIVKQIWGQLAAGGTVLLTETDDLLREIDRATLLPAVTINTVPAVWAQFLDVATHLPGAGAGTLLLGGEALDPAVVERTQAVWPGVRIVNLYGPSECTANATWLHRVEEVRDRTPIGYAIGGSTALVLDDNLEPVPPGALGTLYIAGASVSRGYHGDPRRTAHAYLPADISTPGARMFATGDRVRMTSGGLVYLGRRDAQVKVNGVRVDLEALRADIARVDGVLAAAVVVDGGNVLVIVETAHPDRADDPVVSRVREHIDASWRRELRTSRVQAVAAIPRTPSGKTDTAALSASRGIVAAEDVADTTDSDSAPHRVLEIIWSNVLGADKPTRATSIVALGGDSMKQLKLIALYRRILKVDVSLEDFRQRDCLGDHEDLLLQRVDRDHLDRVAGSLEGANR